MENSNTKRHTLKVALMTAVITISLVIVICVFFVSPMIVSGTSMYPTLENGDLIFVNKIGRNNIELNDIVVYQKPDSDILVIKRVVGVEGDTFKLGHKGNNEFNLLKSVNNSYEKICNLDLVQYSTLYNLYGDTFTIPKNHIFTLGDNRANSNDSRNYGYVSIENLVGKLIGNH